MQKEQYDIEVEYTIAVMEMARTEDDANLLLAMFKQYGESKYKEGVKETTEKFTTKTDDWFSNSILYGTGSSH
jgi:hypothetical protein